MPDTAIDALRNSVQNHFPQTGVYVGDWVGGMQEGNGTALYNNGNKYRGSTDTAIRST